MTSDKKKKIINVTVTVIFCICLVLFMLTFAIGLPIYCRFFYYIQIKTLNLEEYSGGFSYAEIKTAYDEVLNFCTLPWVTEFSSGKLTCSDPAKAHFADCKVLFNLNIGVFFASTGVMAIILILKQCKVVEILSAKGHRAYFYSAIVAVALPLIIIAIVAIVGFEAAFEGFHAIFFPGKDNWNFDWNDDLIIRAMPEEFFMNCAIFIGVGLVAFSAALISADLILRKREKLTIDETDSI